MGTDLEQNVDEQDLCSIGLVKHLSLFSALHTYERNKRPFQAQRLMSSEPGGISLRSAALAHVWYDADGTHGLRTYLTRISVCFSPPISLPGGLNYQIEHHLFPSMPRNRLREAQRLIKIFCQEHAIPYYETSMLRSYREILQHLYQVSAPLRAARKAG